MAAGVAAMIDDIASVYRWDQRGGGRSQRRGPPPSPRFTRDLDHVRQHTGRERVRVLGHSWGAQLGPCYALDHPVRVSGLIYLAGTGSGRAWRPQYERTLRERLLLRWSTESADPAAGARHAQRMADPWFTINGECNELKRARRDPTVGVDGTNSRYQSSLQQL